MKMLYKLITNALLCISFLTIIIPTAYAQSLPQSAGLDSRVQVFNYSPNEVYVIYTKAGYASLIQLENDEQIDDNGALGMDLGLEHGLRRLRSHRRSCHRF
ncbi:virB9-like protein [Moraxella macacae 0408225]|uniref:VirB9-like protein n=2 Tax=Moraxella macacae TaxID=765840 RepID=L2F9V6_9GAMM|nr:virB9-like protein [Moraxella macacae 0408225]